MRRVQIGRFLTPDPAGYIDSPNLYAYVLNDPVNNTDPSGLEAEDEGEEIVVTGRRRSGLGLFFGAFSSGGNIGSGSFFHFLDPLADNGSQGPGMGEMMAMERARERLCAQINDAANRTRSNLPTNPNARTVEGLRFERAVAQLDLQVIGPLANGLGLVSGAASTAPAGPVPGTTSLRFARAGVIVAFGAYVGQKLADRDMARIAAIDARLLQLDALASKVCR